ncbi:MAG: DDE-type integrase/transposase/recombinase, partial [Planctomycetota bacterium]
MPGRSMKPFLPLPRQWPGRVRTAVIHAISLAQFALTAARARPQKKRSCGSQREREIERLHQEVHLLREELRLKDARMKRMPGHRRPFYRPIERLSVLELRAARGWSLEQTAERMLVTPSTVASWMDRLDEEGPRALVQTQEPVNKYPDFVTYVVQRLKVLCPTMGKARIADVLCRAGLHLSATTVSRMLRGTTGWEVVAKTEGIGRRIRSKHPDHIWNVDLTVVPTAMGFWCAWMPRSVTQRWQFCWWVAVVVDHFSRRVMGFEVFEQQPTSVAVRSCLDRAIRRARFRPRVLITDHGRQFTDRGFGRWCRRRKIARRFGAVEKYGSLSVVERLIRTLKNECTRRLIVPYDQSDFRRELKAFVKWYNTHRPHSGIDVRTPNEAYFCRHPACHRPRVEPRRRWPRGSPCAG